MENLIPAESDLAAVRSRHIGTWDGGMDPQRILRALQEVPAPLELIFLHKSADPSHDCVLPSPVFHFFPKLPPEIRHKIWTCILPKPQYRVHSGPHGALFDRPSNAEVLSMLSICSETRAIASRRFEAVRLVYWEDGLGGMVVPRTGLRLGAEDPPMYEWVDFENDVFAMKRTFFEPLVYYRGNAGMFLSILLPGWRKVRKIAIDQMGFSVDGPMSYFTGQDSERVTKESVGRRLHRTGICRGALPSLRQLYVVRYTEEIPFKPWLQREYRNLHEIKAHAIKWLSEGCQICHVGARQRMSQPKIILAELEFPLERMIAPDLVPYDNSRISDHGDELGYPTFYRSTL